MGSVIGLSTNGDDDDVVSVASRTTTSTMFHRDKIAVPPDGVRISFMVVSSFPPPLTPHLSY